ncbi:hypothetical protein K435DRAFT_868690 [Dendrothele bispora CBS 962.96]|uniref:Uncharacterized protein n=1 Tax=Dendrothele bispora (strain CBS 962.96) TaxID=1314807 RepID=A0A4S8LB44_DENBC|nr:hypothetical protein K435DRAFT_868690 [Dendrothele bispora CBS 962.96]
MSFFNDTGLTRVVVFDRPIVPDKSIWLYISSLTFERKRNTSLERYRNFLNVSPRELVLSKRQ